MLHKKLLMRLDNTNLLTHSVAPTSLVDMRRFTLLTLSATVLVTLAGCNRETDAALPPGGLTNTINWAKQQGRHEASLRVPIEPHSDSLKSLDEVLRLYSIALGTAIQPPRLQILPNTLVTWYRFVIREWMSHQPVPAESCNSQPPKELRLARGEMALALVGGRLIYQGVSLDVEGPYSDAVIDGGSRYLLFVHECEHGVVADMSGAGVFVLDGNGIIHPLVQSKTSTELSGTLTGSSLEELAARIKRTSRPSQVKN